MKGKLVLSAGACTLMIAAVLAFSTTGVQGDPPPRGDAVVFVTSQGLYYDSEVNGPLPPHGPFQLLEMDENGNLVTEFGPGDPGYRGGRWKEDFDGDGVFNYFSCPLLPPGREMP